MAEVVKFEDVRVIRSGRPILDGVNWSVDETDRWVILGPNGAGKSTLLSIASAQLHPTSGQVTILDEQLGRANVFDIRPRIGFASSAMAKLIPEDETVRNTVLTAGYAVAGRWNESYDEIDNEQTDRVLAEWQLENLAERTFGTLSDGERKRTLIARAVMTDPELLLLDEPSASLDLGARENLLASLTDYAASDFAPAIVMVTHHVEEIPVGVTHALLIREGKIVTAGPLAESLTAANLTETFGLPLDLTYHGGRFAARAAN
ncbi:ABC transporter ATP-binding protein [Gulosibacter molinativorax]|uniref:ABC transporter ATP-binding protein n=1 Tax=Gulosibacter molinativorax TaxID=256821 RepID=A0ABT7C7I0_9MICO|nr:ABC transporter ATP-binding protein [Gulosibacter molinativorax]MDJ1371139.1 ABC transporter ATP-binding protein [Gulosibacter molinativorax]QUY61499.1 Putative ABC transporter ATP-binding protein YlmA [Gulosibacter molinativorax]